MKRLCPKEEGALLTEPAEVPVARGPPRAASPVAARWEKCLDSGIRKGPFAADEDQLIVAYVGQYGPRHWGNIASRLPHRSAKQCRERWFNHLDPSLVKAEWTPEEDEIILRQFELHGGKWSLMAKLFSGRSDNAIKNRWHSSVSKRVHEDGNGQKMLLPDGARRRHRSQERESPPPSRPASVSPVIPLSQVALPTPVFPWLEAVLSPSAVLGLPPENLRSPTRALNPLFPSLAELART